MHIAIIATSPRKDSNSLRFAKYIEKALNANDQTKISIVDFHDYDIPSVGRGIIDKNNLSAFQNTLIQSWDQADLIFLVMPEYNWTVSGDLINALHQLGSRDFMHLFNNKVFALAGVSSGRGGRTPCLEMTTVINKIINFTSQFSIVSPRIYESHETHKNLDETAESTGNGIYEKTVKDFVEYSLKVAERWNTLA